MLPIHHNLPERRIKEPVCKTVSFIEVDSSRLEDHCKGPNHEADDEGEAEHDELRAQHICFLVTHTTISQHCQDSIGMMP